MRRVKAVIGQQLETKYLLSGQGNNTIDQAGFFFPLCQVANGLLQGQRIGAKIRLMGIHIDCAINNSNTNVPFWTRFIVYKYRGAFNATPPVNWDGAFDLETTIVKSDQMFFLGSRAGGPCSHSYKFHRNFGSTNGPVVTYNGLTTNSSASGEWYMAVFSQDTGTDVQAHFNIRTTFKDG